MTPGWNAVKEIIEELSSPQASARLEIVKLDVTVGSKTKLKDMAFKLVEDGWKVNLNSPTWITCLKGKNDTQVIEARVRSIP